MDETIYANADREARHSYRERAEAAEARIAELEAERDTFRALVKDKALCALAGEHDAEERAALLGHDDLIFQRDCEIVRARAALRDGGADG